MRRKGHPHYGDVMQHMFLVHLARSAKQAELMRSTIGAIWDDWIAAGEDDTPGPVYPGAKKHVCISHSERLVVEAHLPSICILFAYLSTRFHIPYFACYATTYVTTCNYHATVCM